MDVALLQNPGSGSADSMDVAALLRRHGADVREFGIEESDAAASSEPQRLVVAGGDGSVGPAARAAAAAGVPLGVIPVGTANDFARATGIPSDPDDAARVAASGEHTVALDLGAMGSRPFVNVASVGLAPRAARSAAGMKRALGSLAYLAGALRTAATADPVRCRAECDGELLFEGEAWQVTVACSGAFGAGARIGEGPGDGGLDVVVIEAGSRARLVRHGLGMRRGTLESQAGVHRARGRRARVGATPATGFNVDGEIIEARAGEFTIEPGAFRLVVG